VWPPAETRVEQSEIPHVPRLEAYVQDTTRTYTGLPAFNGNRGGTSSWYAREDSNLWPLAPEASALSAELRAQVVCT
jgi:hypothetical protein